MKYMIFLLLLSGSLTTFTGESTSSTAEIANDKGLTSITKPEDVIPFLNHVVAYESRHNKEFGFMYPATGATLAYVRTVKYGSHHLPKDMTPEPVYEYEGNFLLTLIHLSFVLSHPGIELTSAYLENNQLQMRLATPEEVTFADQQMSQKKAQFGQMRPDKINNIESLFPLLAQIEAGQKPH